MSIVLEIKKAIEKKKWKEELQKRKGRHQVEELRIKSMENLPEEVVDLICLWRANGQGAEIKDFFDNRVVLIFFYDRPGKSLLSLTLVAWKDATGYRIGESQNDVPVGQLLPVFLERCVHFVEEE